MYFVVDQNGQFSSKNPFGPRKCSCRCESPPNQGSNPHQRSRGPNGAPAPFDYKPPENPGALIILHSKLVHVVYQAPNLKVPHHYHGYLSPFSLAFSRSVCFRTAPYKFWNFQDVSGRQGQCFRTDFQSFRTVQDRLSVVSV
jgi:hypothetical protein